MTDLQILLYVVGGLSITVLVWSTIEARRRKAERRMGHE